MSGLEHYYSGDRAWEECVKALSGEWPKCTFKEDLVAALNGDLGLAVTIFFHLQDAALDWVDQKIPALDGETPRACVQTVQGVRRLKEAMMRFPL